MDETLKAVTIDALTGEVTEREFTEEEIQDQLAFGAEIELRETEAQQKAAARQSALSKLAALGLTQEEVASL